MKNKFIYLSVLSLLSVTLVSCKKEDKPDIKTYMITWVNYDGDILEADIVNEGELPSYDGITPFRRVSENVGYTFIGWTPNVEEAHSNKIYTATFEEYDVSYSLDYEPILDVDDTILYGMYPKTHVKDPNIINTLNTLEPTTNGWYYLEDTETYYAKTTSKLFNNETYVYNDNETIIDKTEYYFEVERISWNIIETNENVYTLLCNDLIDARCFNTTANNSYENSDIRNWLNNDFYNYAFVFNNSNILETRVDDLFNEKVYLLSEDDYLNNDYGFTNTNTIDSSRTVKPTDYARANGAWYNKRDTGLTYNSSYWTRTSSLEFSYAVKGINSSGYLSEYSVERDNHCVRPSIRIQII